jgi:hypothetical protein
MTLANFNSNFNWQLRALQQAAECCGIVPDLPPGPPPPVTDCYWYVQVNDPYCIGFGFQSQDWSLNGLDYPSGWFSLMTAPPYGTTGNGMSFDDPLAGCGSFTFSSYYMWTVVPPTTLTLPALTGFDSLGNPVTYFMNGGICGTKCYEGSFRSVFGSIYVYGIITAELNASTYSIFVDLTSPTASADFTTELGKFYPAPPLNVTVTINGLDDYTIRIDGLYSLGVTVDVLMDDGITVGTLNEIPC